MLFSPGAGKPFLFEGEIKNRGKEIYLLAPISFVELRLDFTLQQNRDNKAIKSQSF